MGDKRPLGASIDGPPELESGAPRARRRINDAGQAERATTRREPRGRAPTPSREAAGESGPARPPIRHRTSIAYGQGRLERRRSN